MSQSISTSTSSQQPTQPCTSSSDDMKKLKNLIESIKFCMLTTQDSTGRLHSRPMGINKEVECGENECAVWFFTYDSSTKVSEMNSHNHQVNLSFSDPNKQAFVSVSGTGQINKDKQEMQNRWQTTYKAWFPEGLDTPGISLLRVKIEKAEFWDSPSSTVAHAISFIKGQITGQIADVGTHKSISMESSSTSKAAEHKQTMKGEEGKAK